MESFTLSRARSEESGFLLCSNRIDFLKITNCKFINEGVLNTMKPGGLVLGGVTGENFPKELDG